MHKIGLLIAALALLVLALCSTATAQQENPGTLFQRVTVYNVGQGDVIDAVPQVPAMTRVDVMREARQGSLIRLREDFSAKVVTSPRKL